jgi:hypothetical protein
METDISDDVKRDILYDMRYGARVRVYDGSSASPFLMCKLSNDMFRCYYLKTNRVVCDYSLEDVVSYFLFV